MSDENKEFCRIVFVAFLVVGFVLLLSHAWHQEGVMNEHERFCQELVTQGIAEYTPGDNGEPVWRIKP